MWAKTLSGALLGINAYLVEVEVDLAGGLPNFSIVGLPEGAVKESRDRVKGAIKNSGYDFPMRRITANLAPAYIKKEGTAFDLPIAIALLTAIHVVQPNKLCDFILAGELSLGGKIKDVKGVLPMAVAAKESHLRGVIVPKGNAKEAAVVEGVDVFGALDLSQVVEFLNGNQTIEQTKQDLTTLFNQSEESPFDFRDVKGQEHVKRALEVAASGGHNVLMVGPPGSGKTMLAHRISTILPQMSFDESLETTKIYSVLGLLSDNGSLVTHRPFRSPHHTISDAGLIGGGTFPKPGEVSLAHNGVLFLDELPEFKKNALEVLRQPLEDGRVTISRALTSITYPAQFMLVAAMNLCPCGYYLDPHHECTCTLPQILRYRTKISGPMLDRMDIQIEVPHVPYRELAQDRDGEISESIQERVNKARTIQIERFDNENIHCNAQMTPRHIKKYCKLEQEGFRLLEMAINNLGLSARGYTRILKVSRTIADLDGSQDILAHHLSEAIQYRSLDRNTMS